MPSALENAVARPSSKEWFDIVIIIPLEEELLALLEVFPPTVSRATERAFRYEIEVGNSNLRVLVVQQEGMGRSHAARAVSETLTEFDAGLVICLGIAGSLTSDLTLGDVCYSNSVTDVLDNARVDDNAAGQLDLAFSLTHFTTPREIVAAFNFVRLLPELRTAYTEWQARQTKLLSDMDLSGLVTVQGKKHPHSADGLIVCGAVSKSEAYNEKLRGIDRKVLAIETESGGIFDECRRRSVPAITIRGISDYANGDKSRLEKQTGGSARKLAALNEATFLKLQLTNQFFLRILDRKRSEKSSTLSSLAVVPPVDNTRDLLTALNEIGQHIDGQLRELSPDFKLQQRGYRLPTPRMRQIESGASPSSRPNPIEIRDALQTRTFALLHLARNYPDNSLPWVLANDLLTSELGGKQPVPIVIDGEAVSSPRLDLKALAGFEFGDLIERSGVQLVFIFDEVPFKSRSKLKFLQSQIKLYPGAKFLFITREEKLVISESKFASAAAADAFELSSISFLEISHFVQKNFEMTGSESEVIALRLRETFHSFDLSAHPSYFAGIPREILSALLQANRRAELIQLAVDGFLTFVVAGDTANITLSRTTRSRYLRRLAVEIKVKKRSFSQTDIVLFTKQFSEEFDFGIDPLAFVYSFVDAGILHFKSNVIAFSLPFIESYVLAAELASNETLAAQYFTLGRDFDMTSFDLYAEIGASDIIVCEVIEGLERSLQDFGLKDGEPHILLTDKVRPALMKHPEQVDVIQKRLKKTAEDIEHGRGDTAKKQEFLDVADRVREEVADRANSTDDVNKGIEFERVAKLIQNWLIGTMLLGAGAEHLSAAMKQMLAGLLIKVAAVISHRATEALLNVDFSMIKRDFQSDQKVIKALRASNEDKDDAGIQRLISSLVDVLEYSFFGAAIRRVLQQLCEGARQRVLATSVEKAEVNEPIESMIHAAWLADIESRRGKDLLVKAIKQLPSTPFLRSALAAHFTARVYWNHWRTEDRLVLLSAAEECLKGLGLSLKKGELTRYIENTAQKLAGTEKD
jgi:nucleoside phosphorylase